jgi:hypothetical protein
MTFTDKGEIQCNAPKPEGISTEEFNGALFSDASKRLITYADSVAKPKSKMIPDHDKFIMIKKEDMVIKAVSNKISLSKIMEQANATNQNQLVRSNGHGAKKAPIINIFYKFRGLPFEIKGSINDQIGSITMNQAFTNLLNPMIVGSKVSEIVQHYILCNYNVHIDPNNSPAKCAHDPKSVVKAANLAFCRLCAFSTFTNTFNIIII